MCRGVIYTVWPKPQVQFDTTISYLLYPIAFSFTATGPAAGSDVLVDAFKRYRGIIFQHTARRVVQLPVVSFATISTAIVQVNSADETLSLETNQAYNLTIGVTITIEAETVFGALNGLESLSQLVDRGAFVNGTAIFDYPRYQVRLSVLCILCSAHAYFTLPNSHRSYYSSALP